METTEVNAKRVPKPRPLAHIYQNADGRLVIHCQFCGHTTEGYADNPLNEFWEHMMWGWGDSSPLHSRYASGIGRRHWEFRPPELREVQQ
jgi:hypothetical protein